MHLEDKVNDCFQIDALRCAYEAGVNMIVSATPSKTVMYVGYVATDDYILESKPCKRLESAKVAIYKKLRYWLRICRRYDCTLNTAFNIGARKSQLIETAASKFNPKSLAISCTPTQVYKTYNTESKIINRVCIGTLMLVFEEVDDMTFIQAVNPYMMPVSGWVKSEEIIFIDDVAQVLTGKIAEALGDRH